MLKLLFILSVVAIPFNDFYGILPLGELENELSVYLFLITLGFFLLTSKKPIAGMAPLGSGSFAVTQPLATIAMLMFGVIAISFIMNITSMFGGMSHGRYPLAKFVTSTGTVGYGFLLAYMTYRLSRIYSWHELVIWPIAISVGICSVIACFELLAWTGGVFQKIYVVISKFTHLGFNFTSEASGETMADWLLVGRARSICFEPPSLANFASFAWPWVYAGIYSTKPRSRYIYVILWIMCTVLILIANSRTSMLLLPVNFLGVFLLRKIFLSPKPVSSFTRKATSISLIAFALSVLILFFANTDAVTNYVINGTSTSNITRFSSMTAGFNMFLKSPVWGYGFGQYGFHVLENMPPWGYYSWEIKKWLSAPVFTFWPPVFSIFSRFAAELGILGVLVWTGIWIQLARIIWRVTFAYQVRTGQILPMAYPLILSCYCTLLSGIALDSLRTPMIWISLGLSCSYIYDVRSRLVKMSA